MKQINILNWVSMASNSLSLSHKEGYTQNGSRAGTATSSFATPSEQSLLGSDHTSVAGDKAGAWSSPLTRRRDLEYMEPYLNPHMSAWRDIET
jgi:hypothetical protein